MNNFVFRHTNDVAANIQGKTIVGFDPSADMTRFLIRFSDGSGLVIYDAPGRGIWAEFGLPGSQHPSSFRGRGRFKNLTI